RLTHIVLLFCFFFFSSRRRHTRFSRDWSSDVCSSDLAAGAQRGLLPETKTKEMPMKLQTCLLVVLAMVSNVAGAQEKPEVINLRSEERRVGKECRSRRARYR